MFLFAHPEGTGKHVVEAYRIEGEPPQIDGGWMIRYGSGQHPVVISFNLNPPAVSPQRMAQNSVLLMMPIISTSHSDVMMSSPTKLLIG